MNNDSYQKMIELEEEHWWFVARRNILNKVINSFCKNKASILEIGCGSGGNLEMLSKFGRLNAIEFDDEARNVAINKKICTVSKGLLPELSMESTSDIICLFDVLEHIEDDNAALKNIHQLLKTDGLLVLSVPAYMFLWSHHDDASQHKRRYTSKQLKEILTKNGFCIKYSSYFNFFLFPLIAILRFLKIGSSHEKNDIKKHSLVVNGLLKFIFNLEKFLLPVIKLPFGVSIVFVAQKTNSN